MAMLFTSRLLGLLVEQMTQRRQERAFECELHALCTRFLVDEWDLHPLSMLEILELEKMFIIAVMADQQPESFGSAEGDDE